MNPRPLRPWLVLLAATALLAGCSRDDASKAATQAPAPNYAAVARGRIDIEGGLLKLAMPREGIVANIAVHEGDHVHQGQLLAALDTQAAQLAVSAAQAEQKQAETQASLLDARMQAAHQRAERLAAAAAAGAGDGQSADDARESAQQLLGERDAARANAALAAQKVATARYELAQRSLLAPVDAEVVRRLIQPGATVSSSSGAAFVLLPVQARIVRAELNESYVGAVQDGMQAEVVEDSGIEQKPLSAHVVRIGQVFDTSTLEEDPQVRSNTRTVECVLAFDQPAPASLRIGQRVLVRFGAPKN